MLCKENIYFRKKNTRPSCASSKQITDASTPARALLYSFHITLIEIRFEFIIHMNHLNSVVVYQPRLVDSGTDDGVIPFFHPSLFLMV